MSQSRVILVTDATSGIGWATALTLAQHGYMVFAAALDWTASQSQAVRKSSTQAQPFKQSLHFIRMDVTDESSIQAAIEQIYAMAGQLDVVVHRANTPLVGLAEGTTVEQAQRLFDANVWGALRVNQAVLPHMRQRGSGLLIYLSCTAGSLVYPFLGAYNAAKAALEALAETMHYELYSLGVDSALVQACVFIDNLEAAFIEQSNHRPLTGYREVATIAQHFVEQFPAEILPVATAAYDEITELVAELIALPAGQRPFRTAIGPNTEPLHFLNQSLASVQSMVLPLIQLNQLASRTKNSE